MGNKERGGGGVSSIITCFQLNLSLRILFSHPIPLPQAFPLVVHDFLEQGCFGPFGVVEPASVVLGAEFDGGGLGLHREQLAGGPLTKVTYLRRRGALVGTSTARKGTTVVLFKGEARGACAQGAEDVASIVALEDFTKEVNGSTLGGGTRACFVLAAVVTCSLG